MDETIILSFDAELLEAAKAVAAEEGRTLGDLIAGQLVSVVREHRRFAETRERAILRLRQGIDLGWTPARLRHELHER